MLKTYIWFLFVLLLGIPVHCQNCDSVQNLSLSQQGQINLWVDDLDTALKYENLQDIDSISSVLKSIYGNQAGYPEVMENQTPLLTDTSWINLPNTILLSRTLVDANSSIYSQLWKLAKGMAPPTYQPHSIFLRAAAETAVGLLKIADKETDLTRKTNYQLWATQALDSLATMQLSSGAFPFPDLRTYGDPVFTTIIQNFLISCGPDSVNVLQNGWIIDDKGSGEFKFDAGIIANAYYTAYQYTGNLQYKNIALSIADYLLPLKFNRNYNYNSFVALGLGRGFQLTYDTSYFYRGIKNMRYGMFPGQLDNGRWMDGHNAKAVYQSVMIQNTAFYHPLYQASELYYPQIDSMIKNMISSMVEYTFNCDAPTGFKWLIRSYDTEIPYANDGMSDSIHRLIGRYIQQSAADGSFMDVPTMGDYIELLDHLEHIGLEDANAPTLLNIYPNPVIDILNIHLNPGTSIKSLKLMDIQGRICLWISQPEPKDMSVDMQILSKGMYTIVLETNQGFVVKKLIKQ